MTYDLPIREATVIGVLPELPVVHEGHQLARRLRQVAQDVIPMVQIKTPEWRVHDDRPGRPTGPRQTVYEGQRHYLLGTGASNPTRSPFSSRMVRP